MASVSCGSWARRAKEAGPPSESSFHELSKVSAQVYLLYEATIERTLERHVYGCVDVYVCVCVCVCIYVCVYTLTHTRTHTHSFI